MRPKRIPPSDPTKSSLILSSTSKGLSLIDASNKSAKALVVDFCSDQSKWRRTKGRKDELLVRALGLKKRKNPLILDATAGLGRDSFIMACLDCTVLMLERSPTIVALLKDGLQRGAEHGEISDIISRMNLQQGDLHTFIPESHFDIIYLDPMYPHRSKSALVKKEMRLLRQVVGDDMDANGLLNKAMLLTPDRIIIKRPKGAPYLDNQTPHHAIKGKKGRFDIYLSPWQP